MAKLLSSLPVGTKVVDKGSKYYGAPITWVVGGHNHYARGQTVMVSEKIITIKPFDAEEPNNTDTDRKNYGNNRYSVSNIRQWLNSDKASWYSAQHTYDSPPNNANVYNGYNDYDLEAGFLTNFSVDLRNALQDTSLTVAKNRATDGGGSETVTDKVFLLSNTEVGLANENGVAEGKILPLFSGDTSRQAVLTQEAVTKSEYKDEYLKGGAKFRWWLRTPNTGYSNNSREVNTVGSLSYSQAYDSREGVRPALNLPFNILVSDNVNSNGEYEFVLPYVPPKHSADLGSGADNTSILKYTLTDYLVGTTVTEKINGVVVGTKTIVNDTEYTVSATLAQWNAVKYGKYKDTLGNKNVVTLEVSTGGVYTYPFTKTLPTTAKTDEVVMAVNDMSNTAMPSHKKKLVEAIGDKATVGGTGSLEDIAKAVDSIGVESLGGAKFAKGLTPGIQGGMSDMPAGLDNYRVKVTGLSFTPDLVIVTKTTEKSSGKSPTIYRKKFNTLDKYTNLYSAEAHNTTYSAKIIEIPNGFELPTRSWDNTYAWIAFGFEDF